MNTYDNPMIVYTIKSNSIINAVHNDGLDIEFARHLQKGLNILRKITTLTPERRTELMRTLVEEITK